MDTRVAAVRTLERVFVHGQSLSQALPETLAKFARGEDRAFVQALVYEVIRGYERYRALAALLLEKPLRAKDTDVHLLLLSGLCEALVMRTPEHAVVSANANAARKLGKRWAVGLVNALLRRFLRERDTLLAQLTTPEAQYAHPTWLIDRLRHAWPDHWEAVHNANNAHRPMTLRVNRRRTTPEAYRQRLEAAGIAAEAHPLAPDALVLTKPCPVERLPGFTEGDVSVQDAAAQLSADFLDPAAGERVLDACAAPGGKACHLLERQPDMELWAVDVDPVRNERIRDNLNRLGLTATVTTADAATPEAWWDGRPFERILLDAPCSGTGVIRRHPDIKWLRRDSDIASLAETQARLLDALWPLLAANGKLLYVTCSVLPGENETGIEGFLRRHPDAVAEPCTAGGAGIRLPHGLQLLPGEQDCDGFYYACLRKR